MKRYIITCCLLLLSFVAACKKSGGSAAPSSGTSNAQASVNDQAAAEGDKVSARLESAKAFFKKKDVQTALVELEAAYELDPKNPEVLNLRGSCYVEKRDFGKALDDFVEAAKEAPGSASIHFNIGEVRFVTKHWKEAILAFEEAKELSEEESSALRDLIVFKLMLCQAGLGNDEEFNRMASANREAQQSPLSGYTKAAEKFYAGNESSAKEALAIVAAHFPDPKVRAPWEDTMIEFGYDIPTK